MTERLVADFLDWDEEELPPESKDEVLGRLFRGIANTEGAGWFFVQCSRQQGSEVVEQLKGRFGRVEVLELDRESESFYPEAMDLFETNPFDVLVVQGVDEALLGYEDTKRALGWDSADLHNYDSRDVPPLLSHFNQVRECLRDTVPRPVVFVVSAFVVRYLLLRAPDFYDWRAGTLTLPLDEDDRLQIIGWSQKSEFGDYLKLTERQRQQKIIELHQLIETDTLSSDKQSTLLVEEGLLFVSGGSFDQAVPCFHQAIRYKEDNHQAWDFLGQLMAILGRTEEAIASYDKALEIKPDKDEAWYNRGIALRKLERYEEAIASFDKALEIKPDKNEAWNNRGWALHKLERYEEAIASYDKAVEIKPDQDEAWHNRGVAYEALTQYDQALDSYETSLGIKPDKAISWLGSGNALRKLERYEEAIASYDKALEIKPDDDAAWYNHGNALGNLERYEEAIASYDKAVEIKPDQDQAWNNRGIALRKLERYEEAIASYDKALEIKPDNSWTRHQIGWAYLIAKQYEKSIKTFQQCLDLNGDDPEGHYGLACVYSQKNQIEPALEWLAKVFKLDPDNYRERTAKDSDFDPIRSDPRFQDLIQPNE